MSIAQTLVDAVVLPPLWLAAFMVWRVSRSLIYDFQTARARRRNKLRAAPKSEAGSK